jgi:hypothetical protein
MMRVNLLILIVLSPALFSSGCKTEVVDPNTDCPDKVIISESAYKDPPEDELTIISSAIMDDCMTIEFSSSGCDGSKWEIKLIDANVIMESYPVQRNLRLSLRNTEECDAVITKKVSFDISPLQLEYEKILLNLTNSGDQVLYEY